MIYITKRNFGDIEFVNKVWESPFDDLKERYRAELIKIAKEQDLVVNPNHPKVVMDRDHNPNLTSKEFINKAIEWDNFTNKYTFDFFSYAKQR